MNRQQRRHRANKQVRYAATMSPLRSKLIEIAVPPTVSQLRPELQRLLRQHADFLLTLPTFEVCVANSVRRTNEIAEVKLSKLLPNPTYILQNPATIFLLAMGVEAVDIHVQASPGALSQLLNEMLLTASAALASLLGAVEGRLEALKDDPTPLGLTGESAEMFSRLFTEFHDPIEALVEVALLFGETGASEASHSLGTVSG